MATNNSINAPTPIEISNGGTGATNVNDAQSNLGITIGAREIEGTLDEIVVVNGDGSVGNPTISISNDPVIPGNSAITNPSGPTATRPGSPVVGMVRGNTDTNEIEFYTGGAWENLPVLPAASVAWNYMTGYRNIVAGPAILQAEPGQCADSTNTVAIQSNSLFGKDISAVWAEGDGLGGRASAVALAVNTVYYFFAISKADTTVDFGIDTDLNAVNLLADAAGDGYIYFRRIGSCRTELASTDLEIIYHQNDYFYYESPRQDFTIAYPGPGNYDNIVGLSIPPGIDVIATSMATTIRDDAAVEDTRVFLMATNSPGIANDYLSHSLFSESGAGTDLSEGSSQYIIPSSDGTARLYSVVVGGGASGNSYVSTIGWTDTRGR